LETANRMLIRGAGVKNDRRQIVRSCGDSDAARS
jgi:hypothetical protein